MGEIKQQWLDWDKFSPHYDMEIYIKTEHGIRTAIYERPWMFLRATDCTHPLQNMNLGGIKILGWRYVDERNMEQMKYSVNHYARQKEGGEILKSIQKRNFLHQLISKLKNTLNH